MSGTKEKNKGFGDIESNIFKNYIDALFGVVVLLVFPVVSMISVVCFMQTIGFFEYCFPIISICCAGAYDTYGRCNSENCKRKNQKLLFRIMFDTMAFILALIATFFSNVIVARVSSVILIIPGILILKEVWVRVYTAIQIR